MYSAGVLIYTIDEKGELWFLLGRDFKKKYSDFGGRKEESDLTPIDTASRECYEETCGVVMDRTTLKHKLEYAPIIRSKSYTYKEYFMYLLKIKYNDKYESDFDLVQSSNILDKIDYYFREKNDIKWFSLQELLYNKENLRFIFKKTFMKNINIIMSSCKRVKYLNI